MIKGGQSSATIDVQASGDLLVDGVVAVGVDTPVDNDVLGGNVEAKVYQFIWSPVMTWSSMAP